MDILRCKVLAFSLLAVAAYGQQLPVKWEELTAADFAQAIKQAQNTCVLPFGIIEKHGPQLPLGTDLINARYAALHGAQKEFAVVFPEYYFGQIFEARQEPGTVAYSADLQLKLLKETTDEMARNGCQKILIVNGHGGNQYLLPFFAQAQLAKKHNYVVYVYLSPQYPKGRPELKSKVDMHAGESETSNTLVSRPDLVHMDRAGQESGEDRNRLDLPPGVYTGIWWYAKFPDHYAGNGALANKALGDFDMNAWSDGVANALRGIKNDETSLKLQNEFFEKSEHPMQTQQ
ncbi:MAG: creatininase family protein [Acidobacteriaceae bacterium]|nr:creatininase family protein [Acidobacteriaceae bacterium]